MSGPPTDLSQQGVMGRLPGGVAAAAGSRIPGRIEAAPNQGRTEIAQLLHVERPIAEQADTSLGLNRSLLINIGAAPLQWQQWKWRHQ